MTDGLLFFYAKKYFFAVKGKWSLIDESIKIVKAGMESVKYM